MLSVDNAACSSTHVGHSICYSPTLPRGVPSLQTTSRSNAPAQRHGYMVSERLGPQGLMIRDVGKPHMQLFDLRFRMMQRGTQDQSVGIWHINVISNTSIYSTTFLYNRSVRIVYLIPLFTSAPECRSPFCWNSRTRPTLGTTSK